MLRPLAESGQEFDSQQVEKTFDEAADAVFRAAKTARPVGDGDLAHAKTAGVRQNRHEAVQFAIQPDLAKDLAAVTLHAAIVVVQPDAGQLADHPIKHARRQDLVPRVVANLLPAADYVELPLHRV